MGTDGHEPIGSMGNDTPLAVLSDRPQLLYNYFKQLFAQVTNPPLDAIREEIITSMITTIGSEGNLLDETPEQCRLLRLDAPILTNAELAKIKQLDVDRLAQPHAFDPVSAQRRRRRACERRLDELRSEASQAIAEGVTILILSDRGVNRDMVPIPALLATSGVHHHLVREGTRTRCGLVVETGEAREVHHFALLTGYGAGAVNPYLAFATLDEMLRRRLSARRRSRYEKLEKNYHQGRRQGLLKVMSKMGISTQQSYRGAQIFEAIGLNSEFVDEYFTWTASRIAGRRPGRRSPKNRSAGTSTPIRGAKCRRLLDLDVGGQYQWRRKGEAHMFNPDVVAKLQHATQINSREEFKQVLQADRRSADATAHAARPAGIQAKPTKPIPLDEVEPANEIVKRFATGAMSYGSISKEAHETLAIAMNRIGGKSNTGEGGEDPGSLQARCQRRSAAPAPSSKWPAAASA